MEPPITAPDHWQLLPLIMSGPLWGRDDLVQQLADAVVEEANFPPGKYWLTRVEIYGQPPVSNAEWHARPGLQALRAAAAVDSRGFGVGIQVFYTLGHPDPNDLVIAVRAAMAKATGVEVTFLPVDDSQYAMLVAMGTRRWATAGEDPVMDAGDADTSDADTALSLLTDTDYPDAGTVPASGDPAADRRIDRMMWEATLKFHDGITHGRAADVRPELRAAATLWNSTRRLDWDRIRRNRGIHPVQELLGVRLGVLMDRAESGEPLCPELEQLAD